MGKVFHLITFIPGIHIVVSNAHQRKAPFVSGNLKEPTPKLKEYSYTIEFLSPFYSISLEDKFIPGTAILGSLRWALRKEIEGGKFSGSDAF